MIEILLGIIGLLGLLFGFEKFKNNRNKNTIKKQENVIVHQEKQNDIYELHQEKSQEIKETMKEKEQVQTKKEEKVKEVNDDKEAIDIINLDINDWNNKL